MFSYPKDPVPSGCRSYRKTSDEKRIGHEEEAERVQAGKEEIRVSPWRQQDPNLKGLHKESFRPNTHSQPIPGQEIHRQKSAAFPVIRDQLLKRNQRKRSPWQWRKPQQRAERRGVGGRSWRQQTVEMISCARGLAKPLMWKCAGQLVSTWYEMREHQLRRCLHDQL